MFLQETSSSSAKQNISICHGGGGGAQKNKICLLLCDTKDVFPTAEPHPDAPNIPLDQNILERYNRSVRNFTPIEANSDERSRVYESLTVDARNEYQQNQYENIASGTFGYSDSSIHTPQYTGHCNPDVPDDLNDIVSGTLLIAWYVN